MIMHVCDICDTEIDGDYCNNHSTASISSIYVHDSDYFRDEETLKEWNDLHKEETE